VVAAAVALLTLLIQVEVGLQLIMRLALAQRGKAMPVVPEKEVLQQQQVISLAAEAAQVK
jgi:hypothetical protein